MMLFKRALPKRDKERGVAAVEFAIVSLLFFTILLGTIEWGWFFFVHQRVVNASREGARAGTLMPPPASDVETQAGLDAAKEAAEAYLQLVNLDARDVQNPTLEPIDGTDAIRVTINYKIDSLTGFFDGLGLVPTHAWATSVMRWR